MYVFGRMHTLRTHPEGAWRSKDWHGRLSDMHIVLAITEHTIGVVKDTMTRIALERAGLKLKEVLAAAVLAHNEMERVPGFSPGRLDVHRTGTDRSSRAELSGTPLRSSMFALSLKRSSVGSSALMC